MSRLFNSFSISMVDSTDTPRFRVQLKIGLMRIFMVREKIVEYSYVEIILYYSIILILDIWNIRRCM